jgi:hypothetical protein
MKHFQTLAKLAFFTVIASLAHTGHAQSVPTGSQQLELSAFGAATGTFTDIEGGKNLGITAGVDLTYLPLRLFRPSIEIRGTYPIHKGTIDSQKNFLAGVKVEHPFGPLHPYVDFLAGRGEIDYPNGGFLTQFTRFISTTSTIYSPGVGLDYNLSPGLAFKADMQYQHWDTPTPVVASGTIHPVALSLGVTYRFNFNPRHHRR